MKFSPRKKFQQIFPDVQHMAQLDTFPWAEHRYVGRVGWKQKFPLVELLPLACILKTFFQAILKREMLKPGTYCLQHWLAEENEDGHSRKGAWIFATLFSGKLQFNLGLNRVYCIALRIKISFFATRKSIGSLKKDDSVFFCAVRPKPSLWAKSWAWELVLWNVGVPANWRLDASSSERAANGKNRRAVQETEKTDFHQTYPTSPLILVHLWLFL